MRGDVKTTANKLGRRAAIVAAGLALAACQLVANLHHPTDDAPVDGGADVDAAPAVPCGVAPKAVDDPVPGTDSELFALSFVALDLAHVSDEEKRHLCPVEGTGGGPCANAGSPVLCYSDYPTKQNPICDDGRNANSVASLIKAIGTTFGPPGAAVAQNLEPSVYLRDGITNVLFLLAEYNGTENDPAVVLNAGVSTGLTKTRPDARFTGPPSVSATSAVWDGNAIESWDYDPLAVNPRGEPVTNSTKAYVSHSVLVAQFPTVPLTLGATGTILVHDSRLIATLAPRPRDGGRQRWGLERGLVTGNVDARALLQVVYGIHGQSLPEICGSGPERSLAQDTICGAVDRAPDGPVCTGLSIAVTFYAAPADNGGVAPPRFAPAPACDGGPEGTAPDCPSLVAYHASLDAGVVTADADASADADAR